MGRIKNVIVTENGKNIYPEELETRLGEYAEVAEALVLADRSRGETAVKAKIYPNKDTISESLGHTPSREECQAVISRIVSAVNDEMPAYKRITVVEHLDEPLAKTTTQKILRYGENMK